MLFHYNIYTASERIYRCASGELRAFMDLHQLGIIHNRLRQCFLGLSALYKASTLPSGTECMILVMSVLSRNLVIRRSVAGVIGTNVVIQSDVYIYMGFLPNTPEE